MGGAYLGNNFRRDIGLDPLPASVIATTEATCTLWEATLVFSRHTALHAYGYAIALHTHHVDFTLSDVPPPLEEHDTPRYHLHNGIITCAGAPANAADDDLRKLLPFLRLLT
jgi:hypothetical protein